MTELPATHVALPIAHFNAIVTWLARLSLLDAPLIAAAMQGHPLITLNAQEATEAPAEADSGTLPNEP